MPYIFWNSYNESSDTGIGLAVFERIFLPIVKYFLDDSKEAKASESAGGGRE
jgi:hypothetical protein